MMCKYYGYHLILVAIHVATLASRQSAPGVELDRVPANTQGVCLASKLWIGSL